jgi:hypothetical protein
MRVDEYDVYTSDDESIADDCAGLTNDGSASTDDGRGGGPCRLDASCQRW